MTVPESGTLHLVWDNSSAWTAHKVVRYTVTQSETEEEDVRSKVLPIIRRNIDHAVDDGNAPSCELAISPGAAEEVGALHLPARVRLQFCQKGVWIRLPTGSAEGGHSLR